MIIRLDRLIADARNLTRSEAVKAIKSNSVKVNNKTVNSGNYKVDTNADTVFLCDEEIIFREHTYLLLNKPSGVLTATTDKNAKTVMDLITGNYKPGKMFPVGRLDKDTTGLLLITDDGDFAHKVISPKSHITKSYIAELDGTPTNEMCKNFSDGIVLADGYKCMPAALEILSDNTARIIICEGKYHEIKRMFGVVGLGVNKLHREKIGNLSIPDGLEPGQFCELSVNDLRRIYE